MRRNDGKKKLAQRNKQTKLTKGEVETEVEMKLVRVCPSADCMLYDFGVVIGIKQCWPGCSWPVQCQYTWMESSNGKQHNSTGGGGGDGNYRGAEDENEDDDDDRTTEQLWAPDLVERLGK